MEGWDGEREMTTQVVQTTDQFAAPADAAAQLHDAAIAKRDRRLDAIKEKLAGLLEKRKVVTDEAVKLEQQLEKMNRLIRMFRGPRLKTRIAGLHNGRGVLEEKVEELKELAGQRSRTWRGHDA